MNISSNQASDIFNVLLKESLSVFVRRAFCSLNPTTDYLHNWHIDAICDYLEAISRGEVNKLIINMPPRTMKSEIVSVSFPAWLLAKDPSKRIICASYGSELALKLSRRFHHVIDQDWFKIAFGNFNVIRDTQEEFRTREQGFRYATGTGGTVTGEGADIIIGDDLLKADESLSDAKRESTNRWLDSTFFSRLNNPQGKNAATIIVMQRLHMDDVTGYLLDKYPDFQVLKLPLEFKERTVIETPNKRYTLEKGEVLHPERFPPHIIEDNKKKGAFIYSSQYLQDPVPLEGGLISRRDLRFYSEENRPLKFNSIIHSWDTANSTKDINDYSALTVWGVADNGYYLLEVLNERLVYTDLRNKVIKYYERDKPDFVLIENASSGRSLIQELRQCSMMPIIQIDVGGKSKLDRFNAATQVFASNRIFMPERANWLKEAVDQLTLFPSITHDDIADSVSQFINWASLNKGLLKIEQYNFYNDFSINNSINTIINDITGY